MLPAGGPIQTVSRATGCHLMVAHAERARVAIAQGEAVLAERDAHDTLMLGNETESVLVTADALECLAELASQAESHPRAARLLGAAQAIRERHGIARFQIYQADYESVLAEVRNTLSDNEFDAVWAEGAALSTEEAIAYAQRGRGERKRPATGWASLTPTEHDVTRLANEGLTNKDIAARLFVSPRTVQTHLTHIYAKLGPPPGCNRSRGRTPPQGTWRTRCGTPVSPRLRQRALAYDDSWTILTPAQGPEMSRAILLLYRSARQPAMAEAGRLEGRWRMPRLARDFRYWPPRTPTSAPTRLGAERPSEPAPAPKYLKGWDTGGWCKTRLAVRRPLPTSGMRSTRRYRARAARTGRHPWQHRQWRRIPPQHAPLRRSSSWLPAPSRAVAPLTASWPAVACRTGRPPPVVRPRTGRVRTEPRTPAHRGRAPSASRPSPCVTAHTDRPSTAPCGTKLQTVEFADAFRPAGRPAGMVATT